MCIVNVLVNGDLYSCNVKGSDSIAAFAMAIAMVDPFQVWDRDNPRED